MPPLASIEHGHDSGSSDTDNRPGRKRELARLIGESPPSLVKKGVGVQTRPPDRLLATLNKLLDQAVRVVPRPRDNFASAVRAMQSGRYDAPPSRRYGTPSHRFRRLEAHELLARDITAAVDAGAPERESEFLKRVSVRLHAE